MGVDELIARSGVAKATFYKYFRTKDDLVLAYLERWYEARTAAIDAAVIPYAGRGREALLAMFDVFGKWFRDGIPEANAFLHVLFEMGPDHPLGRASITYLEKTRLQIAALAEAAGIAEPDEFAWSMHLLIKGAMVAAAEGDSRSAERARQMAGRLIDVHLPVTPGPPDPSLL